jgi:hypothetical protein
VSSQGPVFRPARPERPASAAGDEAFRRTRHTLRDRPVNQLPKTGDPEGTFDMADDKVAENLNKMDDLDFRAWNEADWDGRFTHLHTEDVYVDVHGQPETHGIAEHVDAMKTMVQAMGGTPAQVKSHPITFGSGDWTCVVGEFENGSRMVTIAKWRDGAIAEEYIWI